MTSTLTPPATATRTASAERTTLGTILVTGGSSGLGAATVAAVQAAGGTPLTVTPMRCASPNASAASRTAALAVSTIRLAGACASRTSARVSTVSSAASSWRILWR